jgi:hypothetical protein
LILKKFEKEIVFESSVLAGTGSGLSKNAGSGSILNQYGSTTLVKISKIQFLNRKTVACFSVS